MQNPQITEIENKYKEQIVRVLGFENLVNVVIVELSEISKKLGDNKFGSYTLYEHKTASTVQFVLYNWGSKSMILSTKPIPIQVSDQQSTAPPVVFG